jgi:hypothetical protein
MDTLWLRVRKRVRSHAKLTDWGLQQVILPKNAMMLDGMSRSWVRCMGHKGCT